jgi:GMP synthase (glutamine-hydrolysing)
MTARDIHLDRILILDFGAQYTQLIARRVREIGVYCEIHPWDADPAALARFSSRTGSFCRAARNPPPWLMDRAPQVVFDLHVPLLGICYGMQTMAVQLGGQVESLRSSGIRLRPGARPRPFRTCCATSRITPARKVTACWMCG